MCKDRHGGTDMDLSQRRPDDLPDDLSLVGFGNPDWFALLRPALTTVALPIDEMAMVAVQVLLKHIGTAHGASVDGYAPPIISRFQAHLIVRASTRALNGP